MFDLISFMKCDVYLFHRFLAVWLTVRYCIFSPRLHRSSLANNTFWVSVKLWIKHLQTLSTKQFRLNRMFFKVISMNHCFSKGKLSRTGKTETFDGNFRKKGRMQLFKKTVGWTFKKKSGPCIWKEKLDREVCIQIVTVWVQLLRKVSCEQ